MHKLPSWLALAVAALVAFTAAKTHAQSCRTAPLPVSAYPPTQITPVTVRPMQAEIFATAGADGLLHLSYAAIVSNTARGIADITSMVPVDPSNDFAVTGHNEVNDLHDVSVTGKIRLFAPPDGTHQDVTSMPGGSFGTTFFDITYRNIAEIPRAIAIRVTFTLPGDTMATTTVTDPTSVSCDTPVVLSPPLSGYGWWDANGCCETVSNHRGATLPVNGDIKPPEQFAIDFVQLNSSNGCCNGPVKDNTSWSFFGVPIYAVADGKVVSLENDMPEQIPGPPVGVTAQNAPGNHIIEDIGHRHYVLYAHLATGSIPPGIMLGSTLQSGQQIGKLGNTGSSTAPHLHFQVMDRPSALDSVGLPFVFGRQLVQGRVLGTAADTELVYESGGSLKTDTAGSGWRNNRMPIEGELLAFHLN